VHAAGHVSWLIARAYQNVSGFPAGWYALRLTREDTLSLHSSWCLTASSQYLDTLLCLQKCTLIMATGALKTIPFIIDLWSACARAPYSTAGSSCIAPVWAQYNKTAHLEQYSCWRGYQSPCWGSYSLHQISRHLLRWGSSRTQWSCSLTWCHQEAAHKKLPVSWNDCKAYARTPILTPSCRRSTSSWGSKKYVISGPS